MQDGVVDPKWGHLIDYTYDDHRSRSGHLSGGLGQLVDGAKGADNFSLNSGFEWVGWKSMNGDVVIEFAFKTLRNFTGALFHSNNLFSSGVEVFQAVDVQYGIDATGSGEALKDSLGDQRRRDAFQKLGRPLTSSDLLHKTGPSAEQTSHLIRQLQLQRDQQQQADSATLWSSDVLSIEYEPDKKLENARPVTVHLKQRLANRLRFTLKFASKWVLVSEVEFLSHPVELMSLASISQQSTPAMLNDLLAAKSYDQYVAILREHQLRRIATSTYLDLMGSGGQQSLIDQQQQQANEAADESSSAAAAADLAAATSDYNNGQLDQQRGYVAGPPPLAQAGWPAASSPPLVDIRGPATNPLFSGIPGLQDLAGDIALSGQADKPRLGPANSIKFGSTSAAEAASHKDNGRSGSATTSGSGGLLVASSFTVISFAVVIILAALVGLFVFTSYKARLQPKLGFTTIGSSGGPTGGAKSGLVSPFMSVFAGHQHHHQGSLRNHHQHQLHLQAQQHQSSASSSLFASSSNASDQSSAYMNATGGVKGTLGRLAALASGQHQATPGGMTTSASGNNYANTLIAQPGSNGHSQLIVSVKDSSSLFGSGANQTNQVKALQPNHQNPNQKLIIGYNQANPLAQQQIYNSSQMNCSNQTFATHYSTMGSSSTANQEADYAIPDPNMQPIVGPSAGHHFRQPPPELRLRSSYRASQQAILPSRFNTMAQHHHQPQQLVATAGSEHNYEHIYHDNNNNNNGSQAVLQLQQQNQRQQQQHTRTLSGQQQQHQLPGSFSSMTMNARRPLMSDCSPGSSSNQSGVTTATTSAASDSSASHRQHQQSADLGQMAHFYCTATSSNQ